MHFHHNHQGCIIHHFGLDQMVLLMKLKSVQIWIFYYKLGLTQLTQTKCDPVDVDDLTWLQLSIVFLKAERSL